MGDMFEFFILRSDHTCHMFPVFAKAAALNKKVQTIGFEQSEPKKKREEQQLNPSQKIIR
jgi:hypothetical protein